MATRQKIDCWQRAKYGAMMGASVGACIGLLFGTMAAWRYRGQAGGMQMVGKAVLQSAASFGLFMAVGGVIRCEERE